MRLGRETEPYLLTGHILCGNCGTQLVRTTLNKKFRYYRCRGAWATSVREKACGAKYIQRNKLNDAVWGAVRQVLENPEIVLAELGRFRASEPCTLSDEIERLRAEIRHLDHQGKRFVKLFAMGEVDEPWIKAQSGPVQAMRDNLRAELESLQVQKAAAADMTALETQVEAYCQRVRANLDNFTLEDKRMALKTLQGTATVTETAVQIKGVVGTDVTLPRS